MIEIYYKYVGAKLKKFRVWNKAFIPTTPFRFRKIENAIKHLEQYYEITQESEFVFKGVHLIYRDTDANFKFFDTKLKKFTTTISPWHIGLKHESTRN